MQCRNCGTEIADKAIICYRCGHATTDPVRKSASVKPKRTSFVFLAVAALLLLGALFAGYIAPTVGDPERWRTVSGVLAGAAVMVIILGVLRRRSR